MSLNNIFGRPTEIEGFGRVYPIQLKDWDEFDSHVNVLMLSKNHLEVSVDIDIPLLDRLLMLNDPKIILSLIKVFNLITRTESFDFLYNDEIRIFRNENNQIINNGNYEHIRKIVLYQNILIEPKVFKNKLMQQWAEKALKARRKNAANVTLEDMVTTVASASSKHYWDLEKYTMYQLKSEFNRINKLKVYDSESLLYANSNINPKDVKISHFAESFDLYEDPYKDVFKKKENLNITKALGN